MQKHTRWLLAEIERWVAEGIVPCVAFVIGIAIFSRFRLTEDVHAQICEELNARQLARTDS
jgi:Na+/melibiose symporter-like transporter